jgi:benzoate membrane transport protein
MSSPSRTSDFKAPFLAGTVASITGTAASTGVVLAALTALGANQSQVSSAVFVSFICYGALSMLLSWRYRMPLSIVWSTPGAAMLIGAGALKLDFDVAIGAFLIAAILIALTGLWPLLGRLVSSIPKPIASAMLAGVIFNFCLAPFISLADFPVIVVPAVVIWLVLYRFAQVWAAPAAMVVLFGLSAVFNPVSVSAANLIPTVAITLPEFSWVGVFSLAIPLYIVTMASQNLPGVAIMNSFGYTVPFKPVMLATGLTAAGTSIFGGYTLNLAAITAALNANEQAHKDASRRWLAAFFGGVVYLVMALAIGPIVAFVLQTPSEIVLAAAGLALMGTITNSLNAMVEIQTLRLPAVITFLVGASGVVFFGIGSAFWALIAGLLVMFFLNGFKRTKAEAQR